MANTIDIEDFPRWINNQVQCITAIRGEMEEIQLGFNSAFVEWKARHDAELEKLAETISGDLENVGAGLREQVETQGKIELAAINQRRTSLREELIPNSQGKADRLLAEGQALVEKLRELNPALNQREERLKAERTSLESELADLNQQVAALSRRLGVIRNFQRIQAIDRQRQKLTGKLEMLQRGLREVREEWKTTAQQTQSTQDDLQVQWQATTLELARLQGEQTFLDEASNRQTLAIRRAARHILDNLKAPVEVPEADFEAELDKMIEYNIQTDRYLEGITAVSGMIGLMGGLVEGLERFSHSVAGVLNEQNMHSAHLPRLKIHLEDDVLRFHSLWDELRSKVSDELRLATHPDEFLAVVEPISKVELSERRIQAMFESLGQSLDRATQSWR